MTSSSGEAGVAVGGAVGVVVSSLVLLSLAAVRRVLGRLCTC